MGMITRVRARLQSIHSLTRIDRKVQDERTAQSVCLLSIVLLLPYFITRLQPNVLLSSAGLAYSCLILPMVVSANYKYPISILRSIPGVCKGFLIKCFDDCCSFTTVICFQLGRCEKFLIKLSSISSIANQALFFVLCDRVMEEPKLTGLYSLLFFNLMTYCCCYIHQMITKQDWSLSVHLDSHSSIRHLAMSTTKIVLEWTKAVTYLMTMVFMLLVFGFKQGLTHYHPSWTYVTTTGLYYAMTEKTIACQIPAFLAVFRCELFESQEHVYGHAIMKLSTALAAAVLSVVTLFQGHLKLGFIAWYLCVWIRWKDVSCNEVALLQEHHNLLSRYRFATRDELDCYDDVCAVCLWPMRFARVTPCQHFFHGDCLRRCLQRLDRCPLCKREFKFE